MSGARGTATSPFRLTYVANVRLPTEQAHGFQIAKMCEALAACGAQVALLHPRRRQADPALATASLADYYGVRPAFTVRALPNVDVVPLSRVVPARAFVPIFFAHALAWGRLAAQRAARDRADVYVTRDVPVAYWLVRLGRPTILEAHAVPRRAQRRLLARIAGDPALRATIALTSFIGRGLEAIGVPAARVHVLPDGVDLGMFAGLPDRDACRTRLGLPAGRPIVGYIGRFQALGTEKGIPELIAALAHVHGATAGAPLLLCVGGPMDAVPAYREIGRATALPAERLAFHDRVPNRDVPAWIRACDVVTIPSPATEFFSYFTSPMKLFEYMAAGAPIVATDLPAIREVLRHDDNALLAAPGDPRAFADALHVLLHDRTRAARLATRARADVERFTWQHRAAALLGVCGPPPAPESH